MVTKKDNIKTIYLAGGCFWGVEAYVSKLAGVINTEVGYANGRTTETDYRQLSETDHAETVKVDYDFSVITLEEILLHFFRIIDPLSLNKQGPDEGRQYRTGVYFVDAVDERVIEKIFSHMRAVYGDIVVEKEKLLHFIPAEEYHQDYLQKEPSGYCHVDLALAEKPLFADAYGNTTAAIEKLDKVSYAVMRENGTEKPGYSDLNYEYRRGIYVDKISGEPLFSSAHKFVAGCGWPSFTKPILTGKISYLADESYGMKRTEVRSVSGDNHLGHVFTDGPKEDGGLRYCINGAALEFIPFEKMDERGYGSYKVFCEDETQDE